MQAIIMAAGKGTRMGELTKTTAKPLLPVNGKPIIEYILERLPTAINHVILVVGPFKEQFKERLGEQFGHIKLTYVIHEKAAGTGAAVWDTQPHLESGKSFLILNGDDITSREDLENLIQFPYAMGIFKTKPEHAKYLALERDSENRITGTHYPSEQEMQEGIWIATGAYVADDKLFEQELVKLPNGEYGLPQTLFKMMHDISLIGVEFKNWIQITRPEDLAKAERILK